jgi:hypothetical protein
MRRILFLLAILTAALSLWTGISIFHARSSNASFCLLFDPDANNYSSDLALFRQVDFSNGITVNTARLPYTPLPLTTSDGKYIIRVIRIDTENPSLQAEPTNGDAPIVLSNNLHPYAEVVLSPQTDWISYVEGDITIQRNVLHMVRFKANGQLERRQRVQFDFPGFLEWSPDGSIALIHYQDSAYLRMVGPTWIRLELWQFHSDTFTSIAMPVSFLYFYAGKTLWGDDGSLVYMMNDNSATWLIFMRPDGRGGYTQRVRHVINDYINYLKPNTSFLSWSNDGRHVLVQYRRPHHSASHLEMWANDGSTRINLNEMFTMRDNSGFATFAWAENNQSMLFFNNDQRFTSSDISDDVWNVYRYTGPSHLSGGQVSTLYTDLVAKPIAQNKTPANQNQRLAVRGQTADGTFYLDLLDATSVKATRVLTGVDHIGEPHWSPDGRYLAVMSATGGPGQWMARIDIIQADGQIVQTLNNGLQWARDLFWRGDILYFVGIRADSVNRQLSSLERLSTDGGPAKIVSGSLDTLSLLDIDKIDGFSFWWRSPQGDFGLSAFNSAGELLHQLKVEELPPTFKTDLEQAPLQKTNENIYVQGWPLLTWHPKHPTEAVIVLGRYPNGRLYWANTNGQWRLLQDNLAYWSKPIWSPDGQHFIVWVKPLLSESVLNIFTAAGQLIWEEKLQVGGFKLVKWSDCQ